MIEKIKAGSAPSLRSAAKANELIDAINALTGMTFSVSGSGGVIDGASASLVVAGGTATMQITLPTKQVTACVEGAEQTLTIVAW